MRSDGTTRAQGAHGLARFLRLIRFSHTVFALPFALGTLFVAADGFPSLRLLFLVLLCMVFARTAAMLFNRLADWSIDQRNPRTADRHRLIPRALAVFLLLVFSAAFVLSAAAINRTTAILSPVALAIVFLYSLTKRITSATHFFLGAALAVAPAGAWIAATGTLGMPPLILGLGVMCWVAGFDLIYAMQDYEFDRRERLHSLVVQLGIARALRLAQWLHGVTFVSVLVFGVSAGLGWIYFSAMPLVAAALVYEHHHAARGDVPAINRAFFESNAFISGVFLAAVIADVLLHGAGG